MNALLRLRPLLLGILTLCAAGAAPGAASAAPTDTFEVIPVDEAFVDEFLTDSCGFEVKHTISGTIKVSEDRQGLYLARIRLKHALIGPGGTLTFPDVGIDKLLAVADDGVTRVETVMATGVLSLRVVIPGRGVVAANTGREFRLITFDAQTGEFLSFEVIVDSGLDRPLEGAALAAVCEALS